MKKIITITFLIVSIMGDTTGTAQGFSGSFSGNQPGITSSAILTVKDAVLSGSVIMNGKKGNVQGSVNDSTATGTVYDIEMQKEYAFTASIQKEQLRLSVVFPELNNQAIELLLQKENAPENEPGKKIKDSLPRNAAITGLWRYTDMISSGYGDGYMSFSTDYFMEFNEDGTVQSWTGKSGGGNSTISISGDVSVKKDKAVWHTEAGKLFFTDPVTGEKRYSFFNAEPSRLLLHDGKGNRKLFQRVR
jgi:hypothetical protein